MNLPLPSCLLILLTALPVFAQVPQLIPYSRQMDLLVTDTAYDGVWRLMDLNQDGSFDGPGEVVSYYDDVHGAVVFTTPLCIGCAPDGSVYVGDSSTKVITRLLDLNGDGDTIDPGEATVFFDATNASGVVMASVQGLTIDLLGRVFLAVTNTSTGSDMILLLVDQNGDGDANDAGEAFVYCLIPGGSGATGNSIPTRVIVGPDSNLYYTDIGSTGVVTKGVYKLTDLDHNGDCNGPGEVTLFWTPPFTANPVYYGFAVDQIGAFYLTDSGNETVWRAFDADQSGTIDATEQTLFYSTAGSTWWDLVVRDDGSILLCDAQSPAHITWLKDGNGDGDALDPGEFHEAYSTTSASVAIAPRAMAMQRAPMMQVAPAVAHLGTTTNLYVWSARPGDLAAVVIAIANIPPTPLAPFGRLEINPLTSLILGFGLADSTGAFTLPLPIPNSPTALNPYWFQTLGGDQARLFLSNSSLLTVIP